jgi:NAD(P)H-hydrate epimerase
MTDLPSRRDWWRMASREVWLPTASEMAEIDRLAITSGAISERALIEIAGRELARLVQLRWPEGRVVALAGSGHNGADALVAVRTLMAWGREVAAVPCGSRLPEPDVLAGWELPFVEEADRSAALRSAEVLLDGVLGTGLASAPRQPQAGMIEQANAAGVPIAAVDGPSGANLTTGGVPGVCVRADLTVTFGWPKIGLLRHPARQLAGDIMAVEIGFPPPSDPLGARAITAAWVREDMLRPRHSDAHKGRAGYLALVAGQEGMAGAAVLAARSAVRGGAGIVRVISDPANREIVQSSVPEAVFVSWDSSDAVVESVHWAHAVAMGPGLGRDPQRRPLLDRVLGERGERPVLMDADALNAWEGSADELASALDGNTLLTPHPGELARLLGRPLSVIVADPLEVAREAADRLGCTVLLKGAPSLVAETGAPLRVSTIAWGAFAAGGTGDVLAGLAGAYLAAGASPADAGAAALLVSGVAVSRRPQAVGHAASDVPEAIPLVRSEIESAPLGPWNSVLFASPAPPEDSRATHE